MLTSADIYTLAVAKREGILSLEDLNPLAKGLLHPSQSAVPLLIQFGILSQNQWRNCRQQAQSDSQWPYQKGNFRRDNNLVYSHLQGETGLEKEILDQALRLSLQSVESPKQTFYIDDLLLYKKYLDAKRIESLAGVYAGVEMECTTCQFRFRIKRYCSWKQLPCPFCQTSLVKIQETGVIDQKTKDGKATLNKSFHEEAQKQKTREFRESADSPQPGKLFGRYEILSELGRGGMGAVYKAREPNLDREVALKVILGQAGNDPRQIKRFEREARLAASLNHPHIAPLFDFDEWKGTHYFTQAYVQGIDLRKYVEENGPLEEKEALELMAQVCQAVAYAHEREIIHRDIKPPNIMLEKGKKPLLMDFGLAVETTEVEEKTALTKTGAIVGSPEYMSPEQALSEKGLVGPGADIYALGGVLYYLLSGRPPFQGRDVMVILMQVIEDPPPRLSSLCQVSRDVEVIVHKCLEKDPSERYPTAAMLHLDLKAALEGDPIMARPPSVVKKISTFYKRNRPLTISALALPILLLISLWIWNTWTSQAFVEENLAQSQKALQDIVSSQEAKEKYALEANLSQAVPLEAERTLKESLKQYLKARSFLEKARSFAPGDDKVLTRLAEVEREIGMTALLLRNYFLAQTSFERLGELGKEKESKRLLAEVDKRRNARKKAELERIDDIMNQIDTERKPEEGLVDEWVTDMVRMQGPHVAKKLVPFLKSDNLWQRLVAIQALGKLKDRETKVKGKDVVYWLMERLKKVNPNKDQSEAEDLVWALGRLGDSRALNLIYKVRRFKSKPGSPFFQNTLIPFRWLTPPKDLKRSRNVQALLQRGHIYLQQQKSDEAIETLSKAIEVDPKSTEAYINRGKAYKLKKDYEKALEDFRLAAKTNIKDPNPYLSMGNIYLKLKDYNKTISILTEAIKINPDSPMLYIKRGEAYFSKENYKKAIDNYNQAANLSPHNLNIYINRGIAFTSQGKFQKALKDINFVIEKAPQNENAFLYRGSVHVRQKNYDQAISDFTKAIEINPKYTKAYLSRGNAYLSKNYVDRAIEDFKETLRLDNTITESYLKLAKIYEEKKNSPKEAEEIYEKLLEVRPESYEGWLAYGKFHQNRSHKAKTVQAYTRAIEINPENKRAYWIRGSFYFLQSRFKEAIKDLTTYIKRDPEPAKALRTRGWVYYKLKKFNLALGDFNHSLEINPSSHKTLFARASVYRALKKFEEAMQDYNQVIKENKNNVKAYLARGTLFYNLKDYKKALKDFTRALEIKPRYLQAYNHRGNLYFIQKDYENALKDFNRSLEINENQSQIYLLRGKVYSQRKNYPRAIMDLSKAIQGNSQDPLGYCLRANAYINKKRFNLALEDCRRALKLNPRYPLAFLYMGIAFVKMKKYSRALPYLNKAIKLKAQPTLTFKHRGIAYHKSGKFSRALKDFNRVLKINPKDDEAWSYRSMSNLRLKNFTDAFSDTTRALKINPKNLHARSNRAGILFMKKQYKKAIEEYTKVLKIDPYYALAYKNRGICYIRIKEKEKAARDFRRYLKLRPQSRQARALREWLKRN